MGAEKSDPIKFSATSFRGAPENGAETLLCYFSS